MFRTSPTSWCSTSRCRACPATSPRACSRTTGRPRTSRCCSSPRSTPRATATGARAPAPTASSPRTSRRPSSSRPCARCSTAPSGRAAGVRRCGRPGRAHRRRRHGPRLRPARPQAVRGLGRPQDVTTIAADVHGFEETVAAVLDARWRTSSTATWSASAARSDAGSPEATYVSVAREVTQQHYREFLEAVAEAADQATGRGTSVHDLSPLVADPHGRLGAADRTARGPGHGHVPVDAAARRRPAARAARALERHRRTRSASRRSPPCGSSRRPRPSSSTTPGCPACASERRSSSRGRRRRARVRVSLHDGRGARARPRAGRASSAR